jgi:hypothetical protein
VGILNKLLSKILRQDNAAVDASAIRSEAESASRSPSNDSAASPRSYRTDAPLTDPTLDVFDRAPFAHRIADTIGQRMDPSSLVVGIYGPWGDGKTTVLNFVRGRLKAYPSVICVTFNPWRMEGEQALLQGFFATLAEVLDKELATSYEKLGDVLKRYGALLKLAPGGWGDAAEGTGAALSTVSLDELRDRVSRMLRESGRRVVILMDDIDRLERAEIQGIFRLVKLTGDFENTAYVLAFDEEMVAGAIGEKYASSSGRPLEAGMNFLEKIVQVPLHLPPPSSDSLRQYCLELVDEALRESSTEMSKQQVDEFVRHFIDGIAVRLTTPRMAKRYANALHFSLTILKGETYTPDLLLVEGLRMFYPKLYDAIRHDPETVLRVRSSDTANSNSRKFIEAHTGGMTAEGINSAASLVEALFPRTGSTIFGGDWEAEFARDQRIASMYYFPRYFTYGVSRSDVPDTTLNALVDALPRVTLEEAATKFRGLINDRNAGTVLYKVRSWEKQIDADRAARLARVLARNGSRFPSPEGFVFFQQPLKQAAICISQLLRRIPSEQRGPIALEVFSETETVLFACECARWLEAGDRTLELVLTAEEEGRMRALLAKRIEAYVESLPEPIQTAEPKHAFFYLGWWERCAGRDSVRSYLSRQIAARPTGVFELMKSYLPAGWGLTTGLPVENSLDRTAYSSIIRVIDPEAIATALVSIYGEQLQSPQYHLSRREPRELRLAHQFMFIHSKVVAERQAQEVSTSGASDFDSGAVNEGMPE